VIERQEDGDVDVIYLAMIVLFFAACAALVWLFERV
jgi:hypothetical protein